MSRRARIAKFRGLGALGALGDNYNATSADQCGPGEMFITDVGCVTQGSPTSGPAPGSPELGGGITSWFGGGGGQSTPAPHTQDSGGSVWTSIIQGATQVGAAAVTGQNPFFPKSTAPKSGLLSGATPWLIGGAVLAVVLFSRRRSAQ